jgi:hypothetical protein
MNSAHHNKEIDVSHSMYHHRLTFLFPFLFLVHFNYSETLRVENKKNSEKIHIEYAVDQLVNTLFSLPHKGLKR